MHKTSCETNAFVSNTPKTPIITNSNYMEKACQTTVDEFNYSLTRKKPTYTIVYVSKAIPPSKTLKVKFLLYNHL